MPAISLLEDMHVHSIFSDGANTLEENFRVAKKRGLRALGCVDHVRASTAWLPAYVAAVDHLRGRGLRITAGVEAKLRDSEGHLDIPDDLAGIDLIYVADHKFPGVGGTQSPAEVRAAIAARETQPADVFELLIGATERAIERYPNVVVAHLFSILPKLRLDECDVPRRRIAALAAVARRHGAMIEIDERWRCPSARTLTPFVEAGVRILASSDSHRAATIGEYTYAAGVAAAFGAA
ncbi:MAG: PHP domain-containing protein [Myxococcota bacterium]